MSESEFLRRCQTLAGESSQEVWTEDDLFGFFQRFRPDGGGLVPLFADIPDGDAVFARLQEVYAATAAGSLRPGVEDGYFIVRQPVPVSSRELLASATAMLENWRRMAADLDETELVDQLTPPPAIAIRHESPPPPDPLDTSTLDVWFYDVRSDWMRGLDPACPHAGWMSEAFYSIACDYALAAYITWPWFRAASPLTDPFAPWFHLWKHEATLCCRSPEEIVLYVGSGSQN